MRNLWKLVTFWCTNHETPVQLYVYEETDSPFYACPKYMLKDAQHPDGHEKDERACPNRISFDAAYNIVARLESEIEKAYGNSEFVDFTGMRFKQGTIDVRIMEYSDKSIKIGVFNKKKISGGKHG